MQKQSSHQVAINVVFGDKTRRIRLAEITFACLANSVSARFSVDDGSINFGYVDEEGDFVQVSSDQELLFAFNQFQRKLRIIAKPIAKEASQVSPAAPAPEAQRPAPVVQSPETTQVTIPAPAAHATITPSAVEGVTPKEAVDSRRTARPKKDKQGCTSPSLKPRSLRLVSQSFLINGSDEKIERRRLIVAPGTKFTKIWKIRNDSKDAWPADTRLTFVKGDQQALQVPASVRVTPVQSSEEGEVRITGEAPKETGKFSCVFRFYSNDKLCGRKLKLVVVVKEPRMEQTNKPRDVNQREKVPEHQEEKPVVKQRAPRVKREKESKGKNHQQC